MDHQPPPDLPSAGVLKRKNKRLLLIVLAMVIGMVALSYASVPLYNLFCKVTGYGGTTQVAQNFPDHIVNRTITIKFDTNTAQDLPWEFKPELRQMQVKLGEKGLANFISMNEAKMPVAGTALFNVTPLKAGKYFNKVQCFCFNEQILQPGERVNMPVLFYVDPKMNEDPAMEDVSEITLSYSFFKTDSAALEQALEAFYNSQE
jgi:cytochrome c oxidase assembly protein subunit 11